MLFGLTAAVVAGIISPILLPHATHPSMVYHILLHIASITIVSFLSIISFLAYKRAGGTRTLFMTLGFMALGVVEVFYLFESSGIFTSLNIPTLDIEIPHVILLAMLTLFGLGFLKVNK
jgi:hypothetical protein